MNAQAKLLSLIGLKVPLHSAILQLLPGAMEAGLELEVQLASVDVRGQARTAELVFRLPPDKAPGPRHTYHLSWEALADTVLASGDASGLFHAVAVVVGSGLGLIQETTEDTA